MSATVNALIDTGAAFTAINPRLAQSCQLIQRGQKEFTFPETLDQAMRANILNLLPLYAFQKLIWKALESLELLPVRFLKNNSRA